MTDGKDKMLGRAAQQAIKFIESAQNQRTGGWRYTPGEEGDTSVVGWQVMALKSAQMAGIPVNQATFDGAKQFLKSCSSGSYGGQFAYTPQTSANGHHDFRRPAVQSIPRDKAGRPADDRGNRSANEQLAGQQRS